MVWTYDDSELTVSVTNNEKSATLCIGRTVCAPTCLADVAWLAIDTVIFHTEWVRHGG